MEYYLCEFEYGYNGQFYQVLENNVLIKYIDLDCNDMILEGEYGYRIINTNPPTPPCLNV